MAATSMVTEPLSRAVTSIYVGSKDLDAKLQQLSRHGNPSLHVRPDHTLSLEDTPIPRPSPLQALVHIRCTGICGSDIHLWHDGRIGPLLVDRPCILGHEAAGEVVAVGEQVTRLKVGDRVAIEPGVPCHACHICRAGKYNLCADVQFAGVCPYAGSIRRFMAHDARYCHKIPDNMSFEQGALLEPLSVILHAIRQCDGSIQLGRPALICGAGPIGLIALKCARASGAWPIVITDVDTNRLAFAKKIMPDVQTYLVDLTKRLSPAQCAVEIRALYGCHVSTSNGTPQHASDAASVSLSAFRRPKPSVDQETVSVQHQRHMSWIYLASSL
jgi:L-iditol 2-dehydrogenase